MNSGYRHYDEISIGDSAVPASIAFPTIWTGSREAGEGAVDSFTTRPRPPDFRASHMSFHASIWPKPPIDDEQGRRTWMQSEFAVPCGFRVTDEILLPEISPNT